MKQTHLRGLLAVGLFATAMAVAGSAAAVEGILPVCSTNRCFQKCDNDCRVGTQDMTCLEWYNRFSSDGDADGVASPADNCPCGANANQANCDGDSLGDACDPVSQNWVFVSDLGRCDWDDDMFWNKFRAEQYGARRYRNTCDNTFCSDRYFIGARECHFSFSGCGSGATACCECQWQTSWCTIDNNCGGPDCPF